ncbi:MAG: insulinase family protein [Deltaproteobacteria bacterium]|nr:insulinase family protein [Deltaproteobacteria bacterium]
MQKPFKTILPNGLTVLLQENHQAPVISLNLWVKVGSASETDDEAGLCHVMEHMLFKGTLKRRVGEIAREVEAAGGDINAYTSFDETVYYINMASRFYAKGLDILADAALHSQFDATELAREKEVVVEEISRSEDNPSRLVGEHLFREAFTTHTYGRPIAGSRETVRSFPREKILDFFHRWYVAPNMLLVIVGDFQRQKILGEIEKLFSPLSSQKPPVVVIPPEPEQKIFRCHLAPMKIEGNYLDIGFHIPGILHEEVPVLDTLSHILGGGESSRLEQVVKEKKQLVSSIYASAYTPKDPCLFLVGALFPNGKLYKASEAIAQEMEQIKKETVSLQELERAKANIKSSLIYERETVEGIARKIGFFEGITGDFHFEELYYQRIETVTPEAIREAARKYFRLENMTSALCFPEKQKITQNRLQSAFQDGFNKKTGLPSSKRQITLEKLKNGASLIFRENRTVPVVSLRTASLGGLRLENRTNNGINHLLSLVWSKGTATRSSQEISEQAEALSGGFSAYGSRNTLGLKATFLASHMAEGIQLFTELLLHPSFPEEEIKKEKTNVLTEIKSQEDSLPSVAFKEFLAQLYPKHPYGLPGLGTRKTVPSLSHPMLVNHYRKTLTARNLVIAVSGDFQTEELKARLAEKLESLPAGNLGFRLPLQPTPPKNLQERTSRRDKKQAHIVLGFLGTRINSPDRYSLEVLNSILAGQGGRLFLELRDKKGLAYAISSQSQEGIEPGFFSVYMGTDPKNVEVAIDGIRQELEKISTDFVSVEELGRSQNYIAGNYELDLQKNSSVAALLATDRIYGLPLEEFSEYPKKIREVTRQDVLEVARKYLKLDQAVLSIVRP